MIKRVLLKFYASYTTGIQLSLLQNWVPYKTQSSIGAAGGVR